MQILFIKGDGLGERIARFRDLPGEIIDNPLIEISDSLDIAFFVE